MSAHFDRSARILSITSGKGGVGISDMKIPTTSGGNRFLGQEALHVVR